MNTTLRLKNIFLYESDSDGEDYNDDDNNDIVDDDNTYGDKDNNAYGDKNGDNGNMTFWFWYY